MNNLIEKKPGRDEFSWMALLQLVLSLLGFSGLLLAGLAFALVGISQLSGQTPDLPDPTSIFLYAAGFAFSGCLLLPSAGYAFFRLTRGSSTQVGKFGGGGWLMRASGLLIFLMPVVLFAGNLVSNQEKIAWILLPPLHILAVVVPIYWLVVLGLRGLPRSSGQRIWGLVGVGLALTPGLILILELMLLVGFVVVAIVFISSQPDLAQELTTLAERLSKASSNPEASIALFLTYLSHPVVVASIFAYMAICVPLIEETLKPLGLWFLMGRKLSPVDGFTAGLLSGAGYALFENMFLSTGGDQWVYLVLARVGTGAVHIFTASLVGWGLASAWGQGRYLRLGMTFVLAVGVHGLWNGLTLLTVGTQLVSEPAFSASSPVGDLLSIGLVLLAFLCVLMIGLFNRRLKRAIIAPPSPAALSEGEQPSDREIDEV